ncbi:hypothetical protein VB711_08425 [Cronbergia sp. UHCC 0137]|uniref:hypothetical protein n=1 Tax=Cronbergia sp. UHCC 0137 TaxID=3110239 RepID=UPI002B1EE203|nr:hypothetical protein [Cronbergia sp. UHCC 0137]MEA5617863.1 hypothetical protein [Cronbergia sp. UHCC 0137]
MKIIICPGIHETELTESFIKGCFNLASEKLISENPVDILVFPADGILALSAFHIVQFLRDILPQNNRLELPIVFIGFSAGVIGAIGAAVAWQQLGGCVRAFIAIDGWGVPLWGNFPIHRLSHDYFTHWSSALLGSGENNPNNFYAEPPVDHLCLWRSPQTVKGWSVNASIKKPETQAYLTASEFLQFLLKDYETKYS